MEKMPKWADVVLIPLISLILAAILSALVILAIGEKLMFHKTKNGTITHMCRLVSLWIAIRLTAAFPFRIQRLRR